MADTIRVTISTDPSTWGSEATEAEAELAAEKLAELVREWCAEEEPEADAQVKIGGEQSEVWSTNEVIKRDLDAYIEETWAACIEAII